MFLLALTLSACAPDDTPTPAEGACTPRSWAADADGDGYGDATSILEACTAATGFVADASDCDDADASVHPGAPETCNGTDDDCDGLADPGSLTWADADGDGYGDAATGACVDGADRVTNATDCDDTNSEVHPDAVEACNGVDDDCDGVSDTGVSALWHPDADGDGYGSDDGVETCTPPAGYTLVGGDCAPDDPAAHPDAVEACNARDDDCDGLVDEGCLLAGDVALADADALVYGDVGDEFGKQLKVGDVTGDGIDDLVVGTLLRHAIGGAAVLPGGSLVSGDIDALGFRIEAGSGSSGASRSIGVGDVDGDGIADIGVGVPYATEDGVRVVLGPMVGDVVLEDAIWIAAATGTFAGHGGDFGDVDGDGVADAVIGAHADSEGGTWAGAVWVQYGPITADVDLETGGDVKMVGDQASAATGRWIRANGDYDGDGISDMLVASPLSSVAAPQAGGAYVVYGPPVDGLLFSDADCRLFSTAPGDYFSSGIGYGDVDGDGVDDVLIGGSGTSAAGSAYVFVDPRGELTTADAALSFAGDAVAQSFGTDLRAEDLDGDGSSELLIGAYGDSGYNGAVYVYRGPRPGSYGPSDADLRLFGAGRENAGASIQFGDLDADGQREVFIGAVAYGGAGAVYGFAGL